MPTAAQSTACLLSESELCYDCTVALDILLLKVVEQVSSVTYHLKQTASGVVILLVNLDVFGQLVNSLGEDSDLNLRRTRVVVVQAVSFDNRGFFFFSQPFLHLF